MDADKIKAWVLSAFWFCAGLSLGGFVSKIVYGYGAIYADVSDTVAPWNPTPHRRTK